MLLREQESHQLFPGRRFSKFKKFNKLSCLTLESPEDLYSDITLEESTFRRGRWTIRVSIYKN